jgi:hypothetical protein
VDPDVFITIAFGVWVALFGLLGAMVFVREYRATRTVKGTRRDEIEP